LDQNNRELELRIKHHIDDLVEACRKNDRSAQIAVYKMYYKSMFNTSYRIVNDLFEAEDIMQEAFLDAFRKLDQFHGQSTFGAWLKRIVVNRSLDALRARRDEVSLDDLNVDLPEEQNDDRADEIQFQLLEVKSALAELPYDFRVILSLYLLEGYDHEEISDILKISYNLSRTRYSRARKKLVEVIETRRRNQQVKMN